MPHIEQSDRKQVERYQPVTRAELAYEIARVVDEWLVLSSEKKSVNLRWHLLNEVDAALGAVQHEFRRRVLDPYEQQKAIENGSAFWRVEEMLFPGKAQRDAEDEEQRPMRSVRSNEEWDAFRQATGTKTRVERDVG